MMKEFLLILTSMSSAKLRSEQSNSSIKIFDGDLLITGYRTDHHLPYLYPLVGPGGTGLTRNFPMKKDVPGEENDHPHHRSFWLTHGLVNEHDFWHSPDGKSKIVHQSFEEVKDGSFVANLLWQHDAETLLSEKRHYEFTRSPEAMMIKVTAALTAKVDVTFGDTKEGSFAMRITPTLRHEGEVAKGEMINSEGLKNGAIWGKHAKWVSYHGPDSEGKATVITMMDHPKNLRHPTSWHARTYGLFAANPFGLKSFGEPNPGEYTLKKGTTLTQRYGVLLENGEFNASQIAKAYAVFSEK